MFLGVKQYIVAVWSDGLWASWKRYGEQLSKVVVANLSILYFGEQHCYCFCSKFLNQFQIILTEKTFTGYLFWLIKTCY